MVDTNSVTLTVPIWTRALCAFFIWNGVHPESDDNASSVRITAAALKCVHANGKKGNEAKGGQRCMGQKKKDHTGFDEKVQDMRLPRRESFCTELDGSQLVRSSVVFVQQQGQR